MISGVRTGIAVECLFDGMRTTIDAAGRLVVPKALRDLVGLRPGPVEVTSDGASLRIEPVADVADHECHDSVLSAYSTRTAPSEPA